MKIDPRLFSTENCLMTS